MQTIEWVGIPKPFLALATELDVTCHGVVSRLAWARSEIKGSAITVTLNRCDFMAEIGEDSKEQIFPWTAQGTLPQGRAGFVVTDNDLPLGGIALGWQPQKITEFSPNRHDFPSRGPYLMTYTVSVLCPRVLTLSHYWERTYATDTTVRPRADAADCRW